MVPGDTLWDLAVRFYGDGTRFPLIAGANHIPNPNLIFPGQVLVIPAPPGPPPSPLAAPSPQTYTVAAGDTLWDIAERFYGNPFRYHDIANANDIPNPDLIFPGQVLVLPGLTKPGGGTTPPPPTTGSHLVAEADDAHLIVVLGPQNIYEESTVRDANHNPPVVPDVARAVAADDSRIVFELPKGTTVPFVTADILGLLTPLGLRVAPLAVPRPTAAEPRTPEATVTPTAPAADVTAIEAPYRLIVSPDVHGGFTHSAQPATPPGDPHRSELWHTRLGIRSSRARGWRTPMRCPSFRRGSNAPPSWP